LLFFSKSLLFFSKFLLFSATHSATVAEAHYHNVKESSSAILSIRDNVQHMQGMVLSEKRAKMLLGSWIFIECEIFSSSNSKNGLINGLFSNNHLSHLNPDSRNGSRRLILVVESVMHHVLNGMYMHGCHRQALFNIYSKTSRDFSH
jgi:hypothetical protein